MRMLSSSRCHQLPSAILRNATSLRSAITAPFNDTFKVPKFSPCLAGATISGWKFADARS